MKLFKSSISTTLLFQKRSHSLRETINSPSNYSKAHKVCHLLNKIPWELLFQVVSYLTLRDVASLAKTCQPLYRGIVTELYRCNRATERALYWACTEGCLSTARRVYESGRCLDESLRHLNRWDRWEMRKLRFTPLNWAIFQGHIDVALFLVQHGANVNIPDDSGYADNIRYKIYPINNILAKLRKVGHEVGCDVEAAVGLVQMLLERGAFANQISLLPPHPLTGEQVKLRPLCQAMCAGVPARTVLLLLKFGAKQETGYHQPKVLYVIPRTPIELLLDESRIGGPFDQEMLMKFRHLLDYWPQDQPIRAFNDEIIHAFTDPTECQLELLKIAVGYRISVIDWPVAVERLEKKLASRWRTVVPQLLRHPVSSAVYYKEMIKVILGAKNQMEEEQPESIPSSGRSDKSADSDHLVTAPKLV